MSLEGTFVTFFYVSPTELEVTPPTNFHAEYRKRRGSTYKVKVKSSENFLSKNGQILVVVGCGGQGLEKVSIFTAKGTYVRGSTSFAIFRVKIGWGV